MLLAWIVGDHHDFFAGDPNQEPPVHAPWAFGYGANLTHHVEGALPVGLYFNQVWGFAIGLEVICERTEEKLTEWQLTTYEAIMRAYFELKAQYDEAVSAAAVRTGVALPDRTPQQNRTTERAELKKGCITLLRGGRFEEFDAIVPGPEGYPEIDISQAQEEGRIIQFFEHAFEWSRMTYVLYPYFWGRKEQWVDSSHLSYPTDPIFAAFLQAGAARVVVPVRRGFEDMVETFLATDQLWGGGQIPRVGDDLYISIAQEIQELLDAPDEGTPEGEPWEVRLPTTLAILQQDGKLPVLFS
jgi:hypothetical protein